MKVVVTGAQGFVGKNTVAALVEHGFEVAALCKSGRIEPQESVAGARYFPNVDVTDPSTLDDSYFEAAGAVIHLVGIIAEKPPLQTFARIHVQGTRNVVDAARRAGVTKFVYISAIGAAFDAPAEYSRTKFAAEQIVRASGIPFTVLRPSIVLGKGSGFGKQMRDLVRSGGLPIDLPVPVIPVPGSGQNLFQPVDIDDLTNCIALSVAGSESENQTIAVGGATQVSFNQLIDAFARAEKVSKPMLHLPIPLLSLLAPVMGLLPNPPFTSDQLKNLQIDNVADLTALRQTFHFEPISFQEEIERIYA